MSHLQITTLYNMPLMGLFRFPDRKTIYQVVTYPNRFNVSLATRGVIIPTKKNSGKNLRCKLRVVPVD